MREMFTVGLAAVMAMGLYAYGSQGAPETTAAPAVATTTTAATSGEEKEETTEAQASSGTAGGEGCVVALCNYSIGNSWRAQMEQEFMAEVERLRTEDVVSKYYTTNSNEGINKQVDDMQNLITEKVNAIVITAASPAALAPVVEGAAEAGIKMVPFDNVVKIDEQMTVVGIDKKELGRIGAKQLVDKLGEKGRIVVLNGIMGTAADPLRWGGAEEVFKQYPDIEILGSANVSWDCAQDKITMGSMLSIYPEIGGTWSQGGTATQGAVDAFVTAGRDLVPMTDEGNNGAIRAWIGNKDKGLSCIAPSNPTYTSAEVLRMAIKALNGEGILGNVVVDIETVTEENAGQYYCPNMPDSL